MKGSTSRSHAEDGLSLVPLSTVGSRAVEWLWTGMLPASMLTLLAGEPGSGKSTLASLMASIVSRGSDWPDADKMPEPGAVVWVTGEEDLSCTIRPRLEAHNADITKFHFPPEHFNAADPKHVEALATSCTKKSVALVVLDPITMIVGNAREANNAIEIRKSLKPWTALAERSGAAVLGISHFAKASGDRRPLDRVLGSIGWVAVARVVLVTMEIVDEKDHALLRAKSNVGASGGGWRYQLRQASVDNPAREEPTQPANIQIPKAGFRSILEGRPDALMRRFTNVQRERRENLTSKARAILLKLGESGQPFLRKTAYEMGTRVGISESTMNRARQNLEWQSKKTPAGNVILPPQLVNSSPPKTLVTN